MIASAAPRRGCRAFAASVRASRQRAAVAARSRCNRAAGGQHSGGERAIAWDLANGGPPIHGRIYLVATDDCPAPRGIRDSPCYCRIAERQRVHAAAAWLVVLKPRRDAAAGGDASYRVGAVSACAGNGLQPRRASNLVEPARSLPCTNLSDAAPIANVAPLVQERSHFAVLPASPGRLLRR
jgi:hypothetical protein